MTSLFLQWRMSKLMEINFIYQFLRGPTPS